MQSDIVLNINEAQAYYLRYENMQGGGRNFDNVQMSDISIADSTQNGPYTIFCNNNTLVMEGEGVHDEESVRAIATFQNWQLEVQWDGIE